MRKRVYDAFYSMNVSSDDCLLYVYITSLHIYRNDTTATGHILGTAENRGPGPNPERMMTPTYCATVRLVLHMAMYIASGTDQEVSYKYLFSIGCPFSVKMNLTPSFCLT